MRLIGHCLTVVVLGIVGAASTVRPDPRYEITHLQSLGGTVGFANGVNNHGDVVGEASLADGTIKPVLWRNGAVIDLGTLGGSNGKAFDINDSGIIVGRAANSSGRLRPFIFDFDGGGFMQEIPPLIGATPGSNTTDGTAFGINASGIAAGHGRNSAGLFQAFVSHSNQAPCLTNKSEWPR